MSSTKTIKAVKSFTVKRSQWGRGAKKTAGALLDKDSGKRCCLGFLARACGVPDEECEDQPDLISVDLETVLPSALFEEDPENCDTPHSIAMELNDGDKYVGKRREAKLREIFRKAGIRVNFVD